MTKYWFGELLTEQVGISIYGGDYFSVKIVKNAYLSAVELAKVPKYT